MSLIRHVVPVLFVALSLSIRARAELPTSCLTSISASNSLQCCHIQPFLEISFQLKFGCDVPQYLDQGVRLEISSTNGTNNLWMPIRFYTPTLTPSNETLVTLNANEVSVTAQALTYNSSFLVEVVDGSEMLQVREYVCNQSMLTGNISIRWMQRYGDPSVEGIATWSLDNVTVTYWNGQCRQEIIQNSFDGNQISETFDILGGAVQTTACNGENRLLYFSDAVNRASSSRRSIVLEQLSVVTLPDCDQVDSAGQCIADGCSREDTICSIGSIECTGCQDSGYESPTDSHVGACVDINECQELGVCDQLCENTEGSFLCSCMDGYDLANDNISCYDVDECRRMTASCDQGCSNTNGSYQCFCFEGYVLGADNTTCVDVDECSSPFLNNCDRITQECNNKAGSYECQCRERFLLSSDGVTCQIDLESLQKEAFSALALLQTSLSTNHLSTNETVEFARVLADLVSNLIAAGVLASRNLSITFSNTVDGLLSSLDTNGGNDADAQVAVSSILNTLDLFALRVYDSRAPTLQTSGFQLRVANVSNATGRIEGISQGMNRISLPSVGSEVKVASFYFKDLANALPINLKDDMLGVSMEKVPVISSSVLCDDCDVSNLEEPVRYELMFEEIEGTVPECYFYNLSIHEWSTNGCEFVSGVCECHHLTHFAILLSPGLNVTGFGLQVVGYVGVSISLVCLVVTIFVLSFVKSLWGMRNFIHINLCISLFVAQLVFVTAVDKTYEEVLCQSIAVVLHYLFLVTFMWMLMEGVVLYVVLVKVFVKNQRLYMLAFALVSYGIPLIYLFVAVPLGFALRDANGDPHYGSTSDDEGCWLRYSTGFIWAFIAPVILIILINVGFFIMAIYIMRKHTKRQANKSHIGTLSQWLKSSITLLITMGIPWIIGVLIFSEKLLFLAYIYTIFIAFQGLIVFILFVPLSKQVRDGYKKWWKVKVSESEFLSKRFSSSDMDKKSSFLGRFSSMRTSTFRMSHHDKSIYRSSQADDHDIKIPSSPEKKDLSLSPPPTMETYMVESQIVVSVGNDTAVNDSEKGPDLSNAVVEAHDNGHIPHADSANHSGSTCDLELGLTTFEEQTMRFNESVSDISMSKQKDECTNL